MTPEERISKAIKESGMTVAAVSRMTGIDYNKLQPCMKGRRELRANEFLELCALLRLDPREVGAASA
ncbi:MAG: helix-turn-helix transcriptional regulator [Oscillospiraceae bacterium]|nr:helix-turn-helix transcriptional regulator [Oscillospiraceae bacterium]